MARRQEPRLHAICQGSQHLLVRLLYIATGSQKASQRLLKSFPLTAETVRTPADRLKINAGIDYTSQRTSIQHGRHFDGSDASRCHHRHIVPICGARLCPEAFHGVRLEQRDIQRGHKRADQIAKQYQTQKQTCHMRHSNPKRDGDAVSSVSQSGCRIIPRRCSQSISAHIRQTRRSLTPNLKLHCAGMVQRKNAVH